MAQRFRVAVINESTLVSDEEAKAVVAAHQIQLWRDFSPEWGRLPLQYFHSAKDLSQVPNNVPIHVILDNSDQAGALGYHDITPTGKPMGKTFVAPDRANWSVTFTHEGCEFAADPYIVEAMQDMDTGIFYAKEVCDAPEDNAYAYTIKVNGVDIKMSDFVTNAWFMSFWKTPPAGLALPPFDFQGLIKAPFELLPGGYISQFVNGQWTQIQARQGQVKAHKANPVVGSRQHKRAKIVAKEPLKHSVLKHIPSFK